MLWTNERADVRRRVGSGTEPQLFRFFNAKPDELLRDPLLDEEPFHGQTDLAAIRVAAPNGRTGCHVKVGIRENDHSVFATKFENRWNQFFRAGFRHPPARGHASGKHHFVRRSLNQSLPDFSAALHDRDEILRKRCVDEKFLDQRATLRREVAVLADDGIPGDDGWNDLADRYGERIVPRRNDSNDPKKIARQVTALRLRSGAVMRHALCPKSVRGVFGPVFSGIESHENVGEEGLDARLAGLADDSIGKIISCRHDAFPETAQFRTSLADGKLCPG